VFFEEGEVGASQFHPPVGGQPRRDAFGRTLFDPDGYQDAPQLGVPGSNDSAE